MGDVAAGEIILPPVVSPGTGFIVRFSIDCEQESNIRYTLSRENLPLTAGELQLQQGRNHFFARDLADREGMLEYQLDIEAENDPISENNSSRALLRRPE